MYINVARDYVGEKAIRYDIIRHESLNLGLYAHIVDRFRFVLNHSIYVFV